MWKWIKTPRLQFYIREQFIRNSNYTKYYDHTHATLEHSTNYRINRETLKAANLCDNKKTKKCAHYFASTFICTAATCKRNECLSVFCECARASCFVDRKIFATIRFDFRYFSLPSIEQYCGADKTTLPLSIRLLFKSFKSFTSFRKALNCTETVRRNRNDFALNVISIYLCVLDSVCDFISYAKCI